MADMIYPDAGQWIDALEAGTRSRRLADRETAQSNFGRGLMTGDYSGAASAIAPYDPNAGLQVMNYGLKVAGVDRLKSTSDALSRGDYAAAAQAAQGDPEARQLIGEHIKDLTEALATHAEAFDGKPPEQWQAIYDGQIKPDLVRRGFAPAELEWQATPENVKAARTQVMGLKEAMGLSERQATLAETERHNRATEDGYIPVPEGSKLVPRRPGAAAPAAPAALAGADQPRGLRNNNPLNLEATVGWDGMTGSDGRYAVFSTPEAGWAAADRNLQTYATKHGLNTVAGVVNRWSPPSENDTAGYIGKVAGRLGVDPTQALNMADPVVRRHVLEAMAEVETGAPVRFGQGGDATAAPQGATQPGDPPGTIYGAPKPKARPATAAEKAEYGIGPDVPAQISPDGQVHVITGTAATLKKIPAQVQSGYVSNGQSISQIDRAIAAIKANPHALGLKNKLGDDINQRMDPNGVPTRAAVANIGSLLIHDRSGAAVTAAEQPRLMPFIPSVSDTDQAAIHKLELLKEQYLANNTEIETVFGPDSGYAPLGGSAKATAPAAAPGGAHAPPAATPAAPGRLKADPAAIASAKAALAKGAPRAAVIQRLREHGIDPAGL